MQIWPFFPDITDCIKRRNLSVLNGTLLHVLKYRYRAALVDEIEELLEFRKKILAIDGKALRSIRCSAGGLLCPRGAHFLNGKNEDSLIKSY